MILMSASERTCGNVGARVASSALMAALVTLWASGTSFAADSNQTVSAHYKIYFAGVDIGDFSFNSKVSGSRYELASNSGVKLLFGAFKWSSQSKTQGTVGQSISPSEFIFNYQIKKKHKRSAMRFAGGKIVKLENSPPIRYTSSHVPLTKEHLVNVLDPMSAIMRMTRSEGDPCRETLEVFDGKMRFRLKLSPHGKRKIKDRQPSGQPGFGYVCRVKFVPVAGYKKESDINYISNNNGIEVVLRPVPSQKILVPYQIVVPTMLGSVVLSARAINIADGRNTRIAMVH